jgi:acyl-CoA synthetase (NDP forming)
MDYFFQPRGIAVIGATTNPFKGGNGIIKNLILGYKGGIYPINPKYDEIEGLRCYSSVQEIDGPVDLAIVFVPARQVLSAVEDCVAGGVRGVMIQSGGFGETGDSGKKLQEQLLELGKKSGIRLWGPNCMGLVDVVNRYAFTFMNPDYLKSGLLPGNVSLIVQSGMLSAGFLVDIMSHGIMGISKVCSVGNKMDIDECDLLPVLMADPETKAIGLYLESIPQGRRFVELCRNSTKPIVVLKSGKSKKGAEAAMSHTASLAGNHHIIEGVLAQAGVHEAKDFKQMMDLCRTLALFPNLSARAGRVAILTFSGGAGIVSSDFIDELNLSVANLSPETREALKQVFPDWMPVSNPVDVWPAMEKNAQTDIDVYSATMKAVLTDPDVDAALLLAYTGSSRVPLNMVDLARQSQETGKPVFIWAIGHRDHEYKFFSEARKYGIPAFQELYRAVECMAAVFKRKTAAHAVYGECAPPSGRKPIIADLKQLLNTGHGALDEVVSKRMLQAYGIPTVDEKIVETPESCMETAEAFGYPLVMKGIVPGEVHKTEHGLVHLGITDREMAMRIYEEMTERMKGQGQVLLQRQLHGKVELILGMVRDAQFGPCVMIGLGGIMAEAFQDTAFAMVPLSHDEAVDLISRIRGQKLLNGFRGAPAVDRDELAAMLVSLGEIGLAHDRIREIDINPLMVTSSGVVAVDATVILEG